MTTVEKILLKAREEALRNRARRWILEEAENLQAETTAAGLAMEEEERQERQREAETIGARIDGAVACLIACGLFESCEDMTGRARHV